MCALSECVSVQVCQSICVCTPAEKYQEIYSRTGNSGYFKKKRSKSLERGGKKYPLNAYISVFKYSL